MKSAELKGISDYKHTHLHLVIFTRPWMMMPAQENSKMHSHTQVVPSIKNMNALSLKLVQVVSTITITLLMLSQLLQEIALYQLVKKGWSKKKLDYGVVDFEMM